MVKVGSKWWSVNGKVFHVIQRVVIEDKVWIHYICENSDYETDNKEFSCYEESFLTRFTKLPDER